MKEAEEYAIEFREELGLSDSSPLSARQLAEHLEIPVWDLTEHPAMPPSIVAHFSHTCQDDFSAMTVNDGTYKEIIHNDSHHPHRQNSNIAHELAHIILGHPAKPPMTDGCRNFDQRLEKEAHDLGFTLLVPKSAALFAVENFKNIFEASEYYSVSKQLLEYRIRKTDARRWSMNRVRKKMRYS